LEQDQRSGIRGRLTGRFSPLVVVLFVLFSVFFAACGSTPGTDVAPVAQDSALAVGSTATTSTSPTATPNPSSTNETVYALDFELPRAGGGTVKLSDVYSRANTILVFYRGYF